MNRLKLAAAFVATFALAHWLSPAAVAADEDGEAVGLVVLMGQMQRHLQKLDLSVQADNAKLASYYIHELEELVEELDAAGVVYEGHAVGDLTASMLPPAIEAVEHALATGGDAEVAVSGLVDQCNACHQATERAWLKVTRARANPYNQDFSP